MTSPQATTDDMRVTAAGIVSPSKWYTADELVKHRAIDADDAAFIAAWTPIKARALLADHDRISRDLETALGLLQEDADADTETFDPAAEFEWCARRDDFLKSTAPKADANG